ncbi:mechanosensitive ion channel [Fulvivirga sp. RKSG066]|uniref:mechanosensitive ion channel family protein n=1 Tax=Fulvivirga aurantia TaxID=2529383 RepID=UPI0012BD5B32|nr:mechanosensitive ion channel domain-containing protein [Fulvivirga aurantia]MTI22879.1 mechanosensitive ion channel [Fulvivirga aurantia]
MEKLLNILELTLFTIGEYSLSVYMLVQAFLIFLIGKLLLFIFKKAIKRWKGGKIDKGSQYALFQIVRYLIWIVLIVLILDVFGVKVTVLIAGSAALLVGIGLGLQQTFNDIISGVILLIEGSIKVDDILEVGDDVVIVRRIGLRTSIVEDRNDIIIILPNSRIVTDQVINWSHNVKRSRFSIKIGVAYGSDVDLVIQLLTESAAEHSKCDPDKKPLARLIDFGESSLDFELFFWSKHMFIIEAVKSDIRRSIVKKFEANGITIPFPQRDVNLKQNNTDN